MVTSWKFFSRLDDGADVAGGIKTHPIGLGSYVRWKIGGLLFVVTVINYVDRQSMSVAAPVLKEEFSITNEQYGLITSAFLVTYGLGQAISGRIIDKYGVKRALGWAVTLWSLACMSLAFGRGYVSFAVLRGILGGFESFNHPSAIKAIAEWFPASERSIGVGIFLAGASFGAIIAPPLLGAAIFYAGWQASFILAGLIGFVWLVVWLRYYESPETHPGLAPAERSHILDGRGAALMQEKKPPIWSLLKHKEVAGLALARAIGDNIFLFFTFWLPIYLADARGLDILGIAAFAWIPFVFTDIGSLVAGWFSAKLIQLGLSVNAARKTMLGIAACLVPISIFAIWAESAFGAVMIIGCAMFFNQFKSVTTVGLPADLFPARDVGTVWGFLGAAGSLGGALVQPWIGWAVDTYSFTPVFIVIALTPAMVMGIILVTVPNVRQIIVDASDKPARHASSD